MGDTVKGRVLYKKEWKDWWERNYERKARGDRGPDTESKLNESDFNELSPMLVKHRNFLFAGREKCRIFVPLSGASPNVKWIADQGHAVVGVECAPYAILAFFETNSIEYIKTVSKVDPSYNVYTAKGIDIVIFEGDYFNFNADIAGGKMDGVSDTASLNTIPFNKREEYVTVMLSLLKSDSWYLLSGWDFGEFRTWPYNPWNISKKDVKKLFGDKCTSTLLDENVTQWGVDRTFLIQPK
uniref:probable thiopurine S-methyltransferase n=1 Tax=Styela clava TaxID=7725 RepID=UPI00193A0E0F|nr:probable thiopurine S-methyltransferase [Styela clava]